MRSVFFSTKRRVRSHRVWRKHQGVPWVLRRGGLMNSETKKNGKFKSKSERGNSKQWVSGVGDGWKWAYSEGLQEEGWRRQKQKEISRMSQRVIDPMLWFSPLLVPVNHGWLSRVSFYAIFRHIFQNYVKGELEKVYVGDDEPCDIVGKEIWWLASQMARRWNRGTSDIYRSWREIWSLSVSLRMEGWRPPLTVMYARSRRVPW